MTLGLLSCGTDKFTNAGVCTQPHELCDDFDKPNETPGANPPWTASQGPLAFSMMAASQPRSLEAPATLGTYLQWTLPKKSGLTCEGKV